LVLDGVIQLTERDEFAYHEMLVHVPMCAHSCPRKVLVVGGGDGGVVREVCSHDTVEEIVVVEIDPAVIDVSRQYFATTIATHFHDPRVTIIHADAATYMENPQYTNYWDVIIGDTSDPVGPAESLFQPKFYESMYRALSSDGGIICMQGECFWTQLGLVSDIMSACADIFDCAEYCSTMVPTYPCGQIGFILATKGRGSCRKPMRTPSFTLDKLRWYSPDIHQAAFCLPPFVAKELARATGKHVSTQLAINGTTTNGESFRIESSRDLEDKCCFANHPLEILRRVWFHPQSSVIEDHI
jgi:spermidine synthase